MRYTKSIFILFLLALAGNCWATDYMVTSAGAGSGAGDTWANAMSYAQFEASVEDTGVTPGDRWFIMGGQTYTLTSDLTNMTDGTATDPMWIIGVASGTTAEPPTSADYATGSDRPLFTNASGYTIYFDDYWNVFNVRATSDNTSQTLRCDIGSIINNCEVRNTGVTASAVYDTGGIVINCDLQTNDGTALENASVNSKVLFNYIHDSTEGVNVESYNEVAFNIIDSCDTGMDITSESYVSVLNNTIYSCTTGINNDLTTKSLFLNNAITDTTTGITTTADQNSNHFDYNNYYNNTTDVSNVTKGPHATAVDPGYTDAPNGNFSLTTGSAMRQAGEVIELGVN